MEKRPAGLLLASQSPRRAQLLHDSGFELFEVAAPQVEEAHEAALTAQALTLENARRKAVWAAARRPESLVVAADTLVYVDDEPLGKPADMAEACAMLERLSGRAHEVCTGVALAWQDGDLHEEFAVVTRVRFKTLDADAIRAYHAVCDPLDKAGGYGIQDGTEIILEAIDGSFSNVMGLPMEKLAPRLRRLLG